MSGLDDELIYRAVNERFTRGTQSVQVITRPTEVRVTMGVQPRRRDYIPYYSEPAVIKYGSSDNYVTSEELDRRKRQSAILIQSEMRRWLARRFVMSIMEERQRQAEEEAKFQEEVQRVNEAQLEIEKQRRLHPRTESDFALLEDEITAWRECEAGKIRIQVQSEEELQKRMAALSQQEAAARRSLVALRMAAGKLGRIDVTHARLYAMAAPSTHMQEANVVVVSSPDQDKAAQLKALYEDLEVTGRVLATDIDDEAAVLSEISTRRNEERQGAPAPTRLEVLTQVRSVVREFDCPLSRQILQLTDREADMLGRQRPSATLKGLRRRILRSFERFIFAPEINPSATRFINDSQFAYQNRAEVQPTKTTWLERERQLSAARLSETQ